MTLEGVEVAEGWRLEDRRPEGQIRRLEERRRQVLESLEPLISQLTQMMPAMPQQQAADQENVVPIQRQPQQG